MHTPDGIGLFPQGGKGGLSEAVALQAAEWFLLLKSDQASQEDHARLREWRQADAAHELAWQRVQRLEQKLGHVPAALSMPVLNRGARLDRRTAVKALAFLLIAPPAAWVAWRASPAREWLADYRTATGEMRELKLADGSRVWLNTATAVDVAYGDKERLVRLRAGEILVETAPDIVPPDNAAYRPFIVASAHGRLRALGTRFVVRDTGGSRTHLAVLEGAVEVRPMDAADDAVVLQAGQQVDFSSHAVGRASAAGSQAADWASGVLRVKNMRLGDFVAELGRYRPGVLRCDPAVAGLRISGVFQLHDTGAVLDSLQRALPVAVVYRTRYWVTVTQAGS
ncbi:FecR domain-containing protein [Candidimonas nitroreducens]|uniref:Fe2+-dicitrate sensor, membrane component n=1 Tax=Candidimonas nitroreducens TaxID=683354 RepID=A0A225MYB8_9BURK|nr:FecR domain-containing protein [Candidimonas nitroreducens]OWT66266.1 hypothetical protein CEY11_00525 [Candidimonas nitroreducens]